MVEEYLLWDRWKRAKLAYCEAKGAMSGNIEPALSQH